MYIFWEFLGHFCPNILFGFLVTLLQRNIGVANYSTGFNLVVTVLVKSMMGVPGANVIKLSLSVIHGFSY